MASISYSSVVAVSHSWGKAKENAGSDYKHVAGDLILKKCVPSLSFYSFGAHHLLFYSRLFGLHPDSSRYFPEKKALLKQHSVILITMIDHCIDFLGPDIDLLHEELQQLGVMHARLGVKTNELVYMLEATTAALKELLNKDFGAKELRAWKEVFEFMTQIMSEAMQ